VQHLDERVDAAVSTLAAAEERLSLSEHDGAQHVQQRNVAQCRCVAGIRFPLCKGSVSPVRVLHPSAAIQNNTHYIQLQY